MKNRSWSIFLVLSLFLVTACCTKQSSVTLTQDGQILGFYSDGILYVQGKAESCENSDIAKQIAEDNAWKCLAKCLLDLSNGQVCDLEKIRACRGVFRYRDDGSAECSLYAEIPQEWRDAWQLQ